MNLPLLSLSIKCIFPFEKGTLMVPSIRTDSTECLLVIDSSSEKADRRSRRSDSISLSDSPYSNSSLSVSLPSSSS